MRHFKTVEDFSKAEYLEIFEQADTFSKGGNFSHLCGGKILSTMFFQESTRTLNAFKSAMLRLGGGVIGMEGVAGSYIATGEEEKEATLRDFGLLSDIMVTRDKDPETLETASRVTGIPVINGGSGVQEHASGVFYFGYEMYRRFGKIDGLKVAIYGAPGPSRPMRAMLKWLSFFQVEVYVDIVVPELDLPKETYDFARQNGLEVKRASLGDIIGDIDVLLVEAVPLKLVDEAIAEQYVKAYKPITLEVVSKMKANSAIASVEPRMIAENLLSVEKDVDADPRSMTGSITKNWSYAIMALIIKLLGIKA